MNALDIFAHGPVDVLAVADIGYIDDQLNEMGHLAARLLNKLADILHHLVGLFGRVMAVDGLGIVQILRALPAHPDRPAS